MVSKEPKHSLIQPTTIPESKEIVTPTLTTLSAHGGSKRDLFSYAIKQK